MKDLHEKFVAIDFETATGYGYSACSVGIVTVWGDTIVEEYHQLIKPPQNYYWQSNINIHHITPMHTSQSPTFDKMFFEIILRLKNMKVVAHNASFDFRVLKSCFEYYGIDFEHLDLDNNWDCTMKIYRKKGFKPANLKSCSQIMGINLVHHDALSDARACALLYIKR